MQINKTGDSDCGVTVNSTSLLVRMHYIGYRKGERTGHHLCLEIDTEGESIPQVTIPDKTLRFFRRDGETDKVVEGPMFEGKGAITAVVRRGDLLMCSSIHKTLQTWQLVKLLYLILSSSIKFIK